MGEALVKLPGDARLLIVRLGSLGDIVHTLPAAGALREAFPRAQIDWLVEQRWRPLVEGNPDLTRLIAMERRTLGGWERVIRELRAARYHCALDFQGLYKSALLAFFSGAKERIGFAAGAAREGGAAFFYTHRVAPTAAHVVEQNLQLAELLGAKASTPRFPLAAAVRAEESVRGELASRGVAQYYVLCPGGGWRGKCWPAEQYGHLHRRLAERYGWRGVVSYGPGERALAEAVRLVAGEPEPVLLELELSQLVALLRRARFVVAGDTGPLHLAAALGRPAVGLYGPTDPRRNGPYGTGHVVVRNATAEETTYKRSSEYSPSMLSIKVEQVIAAIAQRLGMKA